MFWCSHLLGQKFSDKKEKQRAHGGQRQIIQIQLGN